MFFFFIDNTYIGIYNNPNLILNNGALSYLFSKKCTQNKDLIKPHFEFK